MQKFLRTGGDNLYVCQIDISKYYASINHGKLKELIAQRITDPKLNDLLSVIINSTDSGTEHDHLFSEDSHYFTKGRRGIPIGNLTSQLFANIYLHEADMYAKQTLKIRHHVRYMDDILIFHHDKAQLHAWKDQLTAFLYDQLYLTVNPRKVRLYPTKQGVSFVGYSIFPHFLKLRGSTVRRFKRRYQKQLRGMVKDTISPEKVSESLVAWKAHASYAKSENLIQSIEAKYEDHMFVRAIFRAHRRNLARQQTQESGLGQLSLFS